MRAALGLDLVRRDDLNAPLQEMQNDQLYGDDVVLIGAANACHGFCVRRVFRQRLYRHQEKRDANRVQSMLTDPITPVDTVPITSLPTILLLLLCHGEQHAVQEVDGEGGDGVCGQLSSMP